jgi:phosphoglycerol transferase MdoB-like AlkP superfamily enzyme
MRKRIPKIAVVVCLLLPFAAVVLKNFILQGYIAGGNAYVLNLWQGVLRSLPYLPLQLSVVALLFCFGFLFRERGRYLYGILVNAVCTVIVVIDLVYFRAYNVLPAVVMLPLASSQGGSSMILQSLPTLFAWSDLLLLFDFIVWAFLLRYITRRGWHKEHNPSHRPYLSGVIAAVSAFVLAVIPLLSLVGWDGGLFRRLYITSDTVQKSLYFSFAGFHGEDFAQTAAGRVTSYDMTAEDETMRQTYFNWKLQDSTDTAFRGQAAGKNVLVIQVESLENFVIGNSLGGQEITPTLNRLANGGYHFSNIYEQVKCGNSSDCDFMVMTSLLPPNKSYVFGSYADNTYLTLPQLLKENGGYGSAYYHGATDSVWNYQGMLSDALGMDSVHMDYEQDHLLNGYLSDESFVRQTLKKFDETPLTEPFYDHVVTCSTHIPFFVPDGY